MEATCTKNKYCSFEETEDYPDAFKERCIFCGRSIVWKKDEHGRIDNRKFHRLHLRDFCQPHGTTSRIFLELYGEQGIRKYKPKRKVDWDTAADEAKDMLKELRKERQTL